MSTTTISRSGNLIDTAAGTTRVLPTGVVAGLVATAANCAAVVAARAAGAEIAIAGERIPLDGFAVLTLAGALIGIALAKAFSRWAEHPRATFVRTTVILTALSIVPDVLVDATVAAKFVLAATHVIAAAIIVPELARRLAG
jgi:hypothetical protein